MTDVNFVPSYTATLPQLAFEIIYASRPTNDKITKRFYQLKLIANNLQNKMLTWYYFDIDQNKILNLDKTPYNRNNIPSTPPLETTK